MPNSRVLWFAGICLILAALMIMHRCAKAQLYIQEQQSNPATFCHYKADIEEVADAIATKTEDAVWDAKVEQGLCGRSPLEFSYFRTLKRLHDDLRSVELRVKYGSWHTVYALSEGIPAHTHLIQHEGHAADVPLHEKFYSTWLIPNGQQERKRSCCNKQDCYPTPIRFKDGMYQAQRREDGKWLGIPRGILEQHQEDPRESPDYQSHACIAPPQNGDYVYCATLGAGI